MKNYLILICLLLTSCHETGVKTTNGVMFTSPGKYSIVPGKDLRVTEDAEHKINAYLFDESGKVLIRDMVGRMPMKGGFIFGKIILQNFGFGALTREGIVGYWIINRNIKGSLLAPVMQIIFRVSIGRPCPQ